MKHDLLTGQSGTTFATTRCECGMVFGHVCGVSDRVVLSRTVPPDPSTNTVPAIQAEMRGIAAHYAADKQRGGMAAVVSDIQNCYSSSTAIVTLQYKLRACMILDATAAMEDMQASRAFGQSLPYFTEVAKETRWRQYWPKAGFPNASTALNYMVTGAKMVRADEVTDETQHL